MTSAVNRLHVALVVVFTCGCGSASSPCPTIVSTSTPALVSATSSASAAPPMDPPSALVASALQSHGAHDVAESLADEVGPRLAGSPNDPRAVAWAERTMRALGLVNVHAEPVSVPVWKRGVETAEMIEPAHQSLAVTALGWSGATPKEGIIAEVIEVESLDALSKMPKDSAKGKIIFANVPMQRTDDGHGYGMVIPIRSEGPRMAMNAGAAAYIVRSLSTASDRFPHAGSTSLRQSDKPIATASIATTDADLLHRTIASKRVVKIKLVLSPERGKDAPSANVVGEVVGTTKKDEVILLGAHLDSWDLGRGAIDDGAGCGIVLEAARLVAEQSKTTATARTVRVVLFAAEENSAAGGHGYLADHASEVGKFVLAMEADSGTDRARHVKFLGDPTKAETFQRIARGLRPLAVTVEDGDARPGTDVSPLVAAGVPTIEVRQDATRYFDIHHTANDTADKLDAAALAQVSATFAEIAFRVATLDGDLGRVTESKRKPE